MNTRPDRPDIAGGKVYNKNISLPESQIRLFNCQVT